MTFVNNSFHKYSDSENNNSNNTEPDLIDLLFFIGNFTEITGVGVNGNMHT